MLNTEIFWKDLRLDYGIYYTNYNITLTNILPNKEDNILGITNSNLYFLVSEQRTNNTSLLFILDTGYLFYNSDDNILIVQGLTNLNNILYEYEFIEHIIKRLLIPGYNLQETLKYYYHKVYLNHIKNSTVQYFLEKKRNINNIKIYGERYLLVNNNGVDEEIDVNSPLLLGLCNNCKLKEQYYVKIFEGFISEIFLETHIKNF